MLDASTLECRLCRLDLWLGGYRQRGMLCRIGIDAATDKMSELGELGCMDCIGCICCMAETGSAVEDGQAVWERMGRIDCMGWTGSPQYMSCRPCLGRLYGCMG